MESWRKSDLSGDARGYLFIYLFFFTNAAFPMRFDLSSTCKQIFRSPERELVENPFFVLVTVD